MGERETVGDRESDPKAAFERWPTCCGVLALLLSGFWYRIVFVVAFVAVSVVVVVDAGCMIIVVVVACVAYNHTLRFFGWLVRYLVGWQVCWLIA